MDTATLLALSPLDGRYYAKMQSLRHIFSEFGLIKFRVQVEIEWLKMLTEANLPQFPKISKEAIKVLDNIITQFSEKDGMTVKSIEAKINHDVKAVEYFIKQSSKNHAELAALQEFVHLGCTSEDINNLAYGLMLKEAREKCLLPQLNHIISQLRQFAHHNANVAMLARTHGQPATPTTVGKEIANVIARLERQIQQFNQVQILGKLNGASGNYNAFAVSYPEIDWQTVSQNFITRLGLTWNPYTTQIEPHDAIAEYFGVLMRINTILIDFNRDVWGYIAINYFKQKSVANEVGSSTMPHKVNPIDFENAEGNLGIANALFEFMAAKLPISRWQRDLSDSTVLRNVGIALGHSSLAYQSMSKGIEKLEPNYAMIKADLDQHWEILAEAVQTMMRRYQLEEPYEKLKAFTRGKQIDQEGLRQFINELKLPNEVKNELQRLTPSDYLGYAEKLAQKI